MKTAIVFDCEFLCIQGSQSRFWCAAHDPDPVIAQIGAVKLGLGLCRKFAFYLPIQATSR